MSFINKILGRSKTSNSKKSNHREINKEKMGHAKIVNDDNASVHVEKTSKEKVLNGKLLYRQEKERKRLINVEIRKEAAEIAAIENQKLKDEREQARALNEIKNAERIERENIEREAKEITDAEIRRQKQEAEAAKITEVEYDAFDEYYAPLARGSVIDVKVIGKDADNY